MTYSVLSGMLNPRLCLSVVTLQLFN